MRKAYVKPDMYVESFSLAQTIAAGGCGVGRNDGLGSPALGDKSTCGWNLGGLVLWTSTMASSCKKHVSADTPSAGVCYHNNAESQTVYNFS